MVSHKVTNKSLSGLPYLVGKRFFSVATSSSSTSLIMGAMASSANSLLLSAIGSAWWSKKRRNCISSLFTSLLSCFTRNPKPEREGSETRVVLQAPRRARKRRDRSRAFRRSVFDSSTSIRCCCLLESGAIARTHRVSVSTVRWRANSGDRRRRLMVRQQRFKVCRRFSSFSLMFFFVPFSSSSANSTLL